MKLYKIRLLIIDVDVGKKARRYREKLRPDSCSARDYRSFEWQLDRFWSFLKFAAVYISVIIGVNINTTGPSFKTKECNTVLDSRDKISEVKENLIQP